MKSIIYFYFNKLKSIKFDNLLGLRKNFDFDYF